MKFTRLQWALSTTIIFATFYAVWQWQGLRTLQVDYEDLLRLVTEHECKIPHDSEGSITSLKDDSIRQKQRLWQWQTQYVSPMPEASANPEAAWLQIAAFTEKTAARFGSEGIPFNAKAFGFSRELARGQVDVAALPVIAARLDLAQTLTEALRYARPVRVLSVEHQQQTDCPEEVLRIRAEVTFEATTPQLRALFNALTAANPRLRPLLTTAESVSNSPQPEVTQASAHTVIQPGLSRFTVGVDALYGEIAADAPEMEAIWNDPAPQTAGPGWIFELFTPPVVYFDPDSSRFVASPPGETNSHRPQLYLETLARQLYRIQLGGFGGAGTKLIATLYDVERGDWFTVTPRQKLPHRELEVLAIEPHPEISGRIAVTLLDTRSGQTRILGSGPIYEDLPTATLRDMTSGDRISLKPGEDQNLAGGNLHAEALDEDSGEVLLRWTPETAAPQRFVLRVDARGEAASFVPSGLSSANSLP